MPKTTAPDLLQECNNLKDKKKGTIKTANLEYWSVETKI